MDNIMTLFILLIMWEIINIQKIIARQSSKPKAIIFST